MLAAAIGLSIAGIAAFSILPVMIGAIADAQGLAASQAGYVAAADLCGFALAAIAAVIWIRRLDGKRAAIAGLLAALIGNLLSLHAPDFGVLLAARLLAGIGAGTAYAVAISALARSATAERDFGIMVAAQIAFQVIALFGLPRLVGVWGPDAIFLTLATTAVLALFGILPFSFAVDRAQIRSAAMCGAVSGWFALGAAAFFSLNLGALWTYIERIGVGTGLTSTQTGTILSAALALSVLGALGASWLGERLGHRLPFLLASAIQLVALALLIDKAGTTAFSIGAVLYSLAWAFAIPYLYTLVATQDASGRLIVLAPAAQALGAGLGPAIAAAMLSGNSYVPANILAAAAVIAAALCMLGMRRPEVAVRQA